MNAKHAQSKHVMAGIVIYVWTRKLCEQDKAEITYGHKLLADFSSLPNSMK